MSSTFTPSNVVDHSKEREWSSALGMLDWDSTSIVFTKRSLIEFLKYTGTTVDTNFNNISKLPRYAKFGKLSAAPEGGASTEGASSEQSSGAAEAFKPSRRVREQPGGTSHMSSLLQGGGEADDALSQAPPKPVDPSAEQARADEKETTTSAEPEEEYGINFSSGFKPTREQPGGKDSLSSFWGTEESVEEFKPTRRVREGPGGRDNITGKQCESMAARCIETILAVEEGTEGLEGTKAAALAQHLRPSLEKINRKVAEWADWGPLKCLLQQSEIKDGIDLLQREFEGAVFRFGVAMDLELRRAQYEFQAFQTATRAELREALQAIIDSHNEMKRLLAISSPQPVEQVMQHLQEELQDPDMPPEQNESFRRGLWELHNKTAKLPPLTDLTGQVELESRHPEFIGSFNDIYTGTWLDKEKVALRLPKTLSDSTIVQKNFQREVSLWRAFDHPNVLPLYGIVYIGKHLYSVSPWMKNGTAIDFVRKYPQANVLKMLSEVAEGLTYLHSKDIVHGDLRGGNVLISEDGVARLSDFGLSKFLTDCNKGLTSLPINPRWFAPEILRDKPLSKQSDIWSLGMTFLELLTGQQPFGHIGHDLVQAISDKDRLVYTNGSGEVVAGTLEGLVDRLVDNFNLRKDEEYREVILTACIDFITSEDLFGMLQWRFDEAEQDTHKHPADRVATQYNVFMVISYWLTRRQLPVDSQLLWQMREFCENAIRMKSSSTMVDKAWDLLQLIDNRPLQDAIPRTPLAPGRRMLTSSEVTPQGLAIALTLLEGDRYRQIMPCDYLANQCGRPGFNNVDAACSVNNKIILWVKQSLLHYDALQHRADVLKFFIHTAKECRKLRNYQSLIAIAIALDSAPVQNLDLTKNYLSPTMVAQLEELVRLPGPEGNHARYRQALTEVIDPAYRDFCIPWIAVHLKDLHSVLHMNKRVVQIKGRPFINFQRYTKFMDRVREIFSLPPPDLESHRKQGQLAYLEDKLATVSLEEGAEDELVQRSQTVQANEVVLKRLRIPERGKLGFAIPKSMRPSVTG
ncbi:hypothetical protein EST38_g1647 [Candolleomyces aberdarensis]|uniref:Uncharacterized protein n=1 Tax=Candolleomyces aberdarensis TaxID=2316362 RepID=A0A4Q2DUE3_9AGAR|nr:hypothetical protein EST38_g1647 [Candolleomyces aberdarensis]